MFSSVCVCARVCWNCNWLIERVQFRHAHFECSFNTHISSAVSTNTFQVQFQQTHFNMKCVGRNCTCVWLSECRIFFLKKFFQKNKPANNFKKIKNKNQYIPKAKISFSGAPTTRKQSSTTKPLLSFCFSFDISCPNLAVMGLDLIPPVQTRVEVSMVLVVPVSIYKQKIEKR